MGIAKRFINIVKTNRKDFDDEIYLSESDVDSLLKDNSDNELSTLIVEASKNNFPKNIIDAFISMEMRETRNIELVTLQFKDLINKYHPDRNSNVSDNEKLFFNKKTSEIIKAYNTIKKYLEK
jgi:DnaJ-domain-containing protein 1